MGTGTLKFEYESKVRFLQGFACFGGTLFIGIGTILILTGLFVRGDILLVGLFQCTLGMLLFYNGALAPNGEPYVHRLFWIGCVLSIVSFCFAGWSWFDTEIAGAFAWMALAIYFLAVASLSAFVRAGLKVKKGS